MIRIYRPPRTRLVMTAEPNSNPLYGVLLDDAEVGRIRPEQVLTLDVPPGPHTLMVRYKYRLSRKLSLTVASGQIVDLMLPSGWLSAFSGLIWLRRASDGDRIRIEKALDEQGEGDVRH